ncbi:hypothetical protein H5410_010451 [Solanum commersonii]|uniref:Uncharacterized protein n=1 Tax=Solanum commersonii TaxID=4109 RepID=A0A9J6ALF3_SOLCO|nr:hypothetical protein H5410_010451 [Solanum commersonii]
MEPPDMIGRPKKKRDRTTDEARKRKGEWSSSRKGKRVNRFQRKAKAKKKLVRHQLEHNNRPCLKKQQYELNLANHLNNQPFKLNLILKAAYGPDIGDDEDPILRPKTISEANTLLAMRKSRMTPSTGGGRIQFIGDATGVSTPTNFPYSPTKITCFDALSKTIGKQVKLTENDNDLIQEKYVSPTTLNSKLSPKTPKDESRALVSNTIDLGEDSLDKDEEDNIFDLGKDSLDKDEEDNMLDLGEDSLDEDEEDMLDICFDRVAREGDISPRRQRSGSNKSKKKTYERQHSWDGKLTEEFVLRHLPMRQTKHNHLTISIGSTRSNKSIKKV